MADIVSGIISALVTAFTDFMGGVGSGVTGLFKDLFTETTASGTTLSVFAYVSFALMGLGLAIGIFRWLMRKVG